MNGFMTISGNKHIFDNVIEPESKIIFYSRILDRRVMGSMNDLIFQAKFHIDEDHETLFKTSILLNETPMSYLKYDRPKELFQKLYMPEKEASK